MHGEIGAGQAARAALPRLALRRGDHRLQHRHAGRVEHRRLARIAGGEGGEGDDDGGIQLRQRFGEEGGGGRILQAGDEDRLWREAARFERGAERVDRRRIVGEPHGAVEDDGDGGRRKPLTPTLSPTGRGEEEVAAAGKALSPWGRGLGEGDHA